MIATHSIWPHSSLFSVLLLWLGFWVSATAQPAPLTRIPDIRRLSREDAARALPVKFSGVCVFGSVTDETGSVAVSDGEQSILAVTQTITKKTPNSEVGNARHFVPGAQLEVVGVTDSGDYAPMILMSKIRRVGTLPVPKPRRPRMEDLLSGVEDGQWVELEGVVQDAGKFLGKFQAFLMTDGQICRFTLTEAVSSALIDARVRVRGIFAPDANGRSEAMFLKLMVGDASRDIEVIERPPLDPFNAPSVPLSRLMPFSLNARPFNRKVTSGVVTFAAPGRFFFIQDGSVGVRVDSNSQDAKAGQRVDVAGFVDTSHTLASLKNATVRTTGTAPLPQPLPTTVERLLDPSVRATWGKALSDDLSGRAVILQGQLKRVDWKSEKEPESVWIDSGGRTFEARLPVGRKLSSSEADTWVPGAEVELTGVCELVFQATGMTVGDYRPISFHLWMSGPEGGRILHLPPWWTAFRLALALGGVGLVLLLVIAWTWVLRRQVEIQTRIIGEKERVEAAYAERARIARDMHDELGAGMTEVAMLSDLALQDRNRPQELDQRLERIFRSALEITQSLDQIVWVVNPANDSLEKFIAFTSELAQTTLTPVGIRCRLDLPEAPPSIPVPAQVRHQFCMALKEAIHNIIKHAHAREVRIRVVLKGSTLSLRICDDGTGFDSSALQNAAGSHDGLYNLRQRMREIGGICEIDSSPGKGASVLLEAEI